MRRARGEGDRHLIAPCGINCGLCRAYRRVRNPCPGCRAGDGNKSNACVTCAIKRCPARAAGAHEFCFSCAEFPCARLKTLDRRYRTRYGVSVLENLDQIKSAGLTRFVAEEALTWRCTRCGASLCMHQPECPGCGQRWMAR